MKIVQYSAKKIKDSRGKETIEVSINGIRASSPSGTSAGKYETPSYHNDLEWNIKAINNFVELRGLEIRSFGDLHLLEDLIIRKFRLRNAKEFGANSLFALESAILKALAKSKRQELWQVINPRAKRIPIPLGNVIGGGLHVKNKKSPTFQEFLLLPQGKNIRENVKIMTSIHKKIGKKIKARIKGQEGEWESNLFEENILDLLSKIKEIKIGLDVAASTFFKGNYKYKNKVLSRKEQIIYVNELISKYKLLYVEDPLNEEDFEGFFNISKKTLVCGDDLTVSNLDRVKKAFDKRAINCVILKPNQNGSLLEIESIVRFCKRNGVKMVFSHRAGETMDDALADYAFAFQTDFIKCGISTRWREIKLKRLIKISNQIK